MSRIRDADYSIQEELAKTFFASSTNTEAKNGRKKKNTLKTPLLILLIAFFLVASLVLILHSRVDIKISITAKAPLPAHGNTFFIRDGKPNRKLVGKMGFFGDAQRFSRQKDNMLILINSKGWGWSNFSIELKKPMDMERRHMSYVAKGQIGNERLIPVFVDIDNKSYRMPGELFTVLTKEWQEYTVNLAPIKSAIDLSSISIIKFEFGSLTAGNYPAATIFLRDVGIKRP